MLEAVGLDANEAQHAADQGLGTQFDVTPTSIHGICWVDDNDGTASVPVYFAWNQMRLVTVRDGGDPGIAVVRQRIADRTSVLSQDPSTLPGVVLQLMLATVQHGLTQTMVSVSSLDMEIVSTVTPQKGQGDQLLQFRTQVQPISARFPMYQVNVESALIDPASVEGLDSGGMNQMQQFLSAVQATSGLIANLAGEIKSAAQDIQAQVSAWQGARINVLTIVTMIFLPITFLTGYFGMNFNWLDDQLNSYWSWMLLGVFFPIVLVLACAAILRASGYWVPKFLRRRKRPNG
jgi:Mg2+ and Co2+ transporter CorA